MKFITIATLDFNHDTFITKDVQPYSNYL
ncbi:hypothetical protein A1E_00295 [Rickettsia canadensis str. McKiel]|uniref:Uncharacterized protein n=1 Tax=Rickettsia canadensis (strain McKiel) TaxID=293613 RepID=A8EXC9_RICCK|nr:hypothetical protein A1E_00295 [Rickettsia canadensis str. McKiel]